MATADVVQAQYEQLEEIADRFDRQFESIRGMNRILQQHFDALREGGWVGQAADVFGGEMHDIVFPAMLRLGTALENGHDVARRSVMILRAAEQEAAEQFRIGHSRGERNSGRTDRRIDREIQSDKRWNRQQNDNDGHLGNDWAGRMILDHYLRGQDDWTIQDDPRWTTYMQGNKILSSDLESRALQEARLLYQTGQSSLLISETYSMEIENGEGIVGYQYLHGTNTNAGDFEREGEATITTNVNGGYTVRLDLRYTWNDIIDPNPKYSTDRSKSRLAEILTLGQADAYEIHISWAETINVQLDGNGQVVSVHRE